MNTPPPIQDITLRDYFAAAALTGLLASEVNAQITEFAATAYQFADQMLKERQNDLA